MIEYLTGDGKVAYVAPGPAGNFTFYLRPQGRRDLKGKRVKGRAWDLWFPTRTEAEEGLKVYAKRRGWSPGFHVPACMAAMFTNI